jgi:hypothetical protein
MSCASFHKLEFLIVIEVRVRGIEGVGLHHQQLDVGMTLQFLGVGLRLMVGLAIESA